MTPAVRRAVGIADDLQAGARYFGDLTKRYGRDDYAVAAFRAGTSNVSRSRPMTVETLHYVAAVGSYRNVLRVHETSLRHHARELLLDRVQPDDTWGSLAARLRVPVVRLRMYNAQLAARPMTPGSLVAYPSPTPNVRPLFSANADAVVYRSRIGDTYDTIAMALELDMELLRQTNHLWYQQEIPAGMDLEIPLDWTGVSTEHRVEAGETSVAQVATRLETDAWRIIRDNGLILDDRLSAGMVLRVRREPAAPVQAAAAVENVTYRVERGDTLAAIARRHGTTVAAIQEANNMGRRTTIRIGQELRIPATGS
jgi:LysM repeat protein